MSDISPLSSVSRVAARICTVSQGMNPPLGLFSCFSSFLQQLLPLEPPSPPFPFVSELDILSLCFATPRSSPCHIIITIIDMSWWCQAGRETQADRENNEYRSRSRVLNDRSGMAELIVNPIRTASVWTSVGWRSDPLLMSRVLPFLARGSRTIFSTSSCKILLVMLASPLKTNCCTHIPLSCICVITGTFFTCLRSSKLSAQFASSTVEVNSMISSWLLLLFSVCWQEGWLKNCYLPRSELLRFPPLSEACMLPSLQLLAFNLWAHSSPLASYPSSF